jgi:hypothetical protein
MPVQLIEEMVSFVIWSSWSRLPTGGSLGIFDFGGGTLGDLYDFFGPCTWIAGPLDLIGRHPVLYRLWAVMSP